MERFASTVDHHGRIIQGKQIYTKSMERFASTVDHHGRIIQGKQIYTKETRFPLVLISVLIFICLNTVAVAVSLSKPGCSDRCGNVTIPYPFGIGSGCSFNSSYTVICQNSSIPILSSIHVEAVNISIESRMVEVKQPVLPIACSSEPNTHSFGKLLLGSPFTISEVYNSLVVLGCQSVAWLRAHETTTIGGCMAICDANATHMTGCSGVNCCQISIPKGLQELEFTYQSVVGYGNNGSNFCGYVFLAEQKWFQEDYKSHKKLQSDLLNPFDDEFRYTTVVLDWKLNSADLSPYASSGCYDDNPQDATPYFSTMRFYEFMQTRPDCIPIGYRYYLGLPIPTPPPIDCYCLYGYEGNPYILGGCHDIDECNSSTLNACQDVPCTNLNGSYECDFPGMNDNSSRMKIAFISIGGGIGALLLLVAGMKSSKVLWKRFKDYRKRTLFKQNGGLLLERHELSSTKKGVQKTKLFSSKELSKATDRYNENRVLGRGGQGTVYKGMLTDGRIVAVKKSKKINEGDIEVFINEVVILSQINHRNVVKLLGCCLETEIPLLVYEFVPNGTLFRHIHEPNEEFPLTWDMRVRIATEVANSLSYLHSAASAPIYHRDIKSTNILLDDKYRAKISDFGTSRSISIDQTHLTTRVLGTFGYLDPEYFQSSQFTDKSDVYSFGVVMVELITGEKAVSSIRAEVGRSLATHFLHSMEENQLFDILDARVLNEGPREEIVAIAELARRCLDLNGKRRPTMKEVGMELEGIQTSKEKTAFQNNVDDEESHAIDVSESSDFSSISESTHLDTITENSD